MLNRIFAPIRPALPLVVAAILAAYAPSSSAAPLTVTVSNAINNAPLSGLNVVAMERAGEQLIYRSKRATDRVNGGIHMGSEGWPGLDEDQLFQRRYLRHRIDYRNVMAEVLSRHLGASDTSEILPGHSPEPVGFLVA